MTQTIRTLMAGLIDYAGLFPPAGLGMDMAVANYDAYLAGPHEWMLGRFICPVSRLDEFRRHADDHLPRDDAASPWQLSAIIDGELNADLDTILAFNDVHGDTGNGLAIVDTIELRAGSPGFIDEALDLIPEDLLPHFEVPTAGDVRGFIAALAGNDAAAKIRTGGVQPEMFPSSAQVGAFLWACAVADVPFKATAGLHHPLRAEHPLTYEPNAPCGVMHGFLNVFVGAAVMRERRLDASQLASLLDRRDADAFRFDDASVRFGDHAIEAAALARWRESFALSYGSCSFEEPIADLQRLQLL